ARRHVFSYGNLPSFRRQFSRFRLSDSAAFALVMLIWAVEFYVAVSLISGRAWLILAWLWLVWPFALALHPAGTRRRVIVPLVIGIILLAPCAGSVFLFTVWALEH